MNEQLQNLSLREKIGQLFFIGIAGPEIDGPTSELLDEVLPGGVCLFSRNIREATQTRDLLDGIRELLPVPPVLSLDQEGGTVDRLRRLVTPIAAASRIRTVAEASTFARFIGETISLLGFNMDFAPVVDVIDARRASTSNGLFSRPFGSSREDVVLLAGEFLRVLQQQGPLGCLKHFPGLGAATVDSHEELPVVEITGDELASIDLYPYRSLFAAGGVHAVMVAHACFPLSDLQETGRNGKLLPSSLSSEFITTLLRGELRFDGVVITDDLEMGAIIKNYGIGEASVMAVEAGADMLAICAGAENIREGFEAINDAVTSGRIPVERIDATLARIAALKADLHAPPPLDLERLEQLSIGIAAFNAQIVQN
jgi:beta-N-acetylhexosaminidase